MIDGYKKGEKLKVIIERERISQEEFPQIVERIFDICKTDPTFNMKDSVQDKEKYTSKLIEKLEKKESLYDKVSKIRKDLQKRVKDLDEKNFDLKESLLRELGSES